MASFPQSSSRPVDGPDMKPTEIESTTNIDDDYETLGDREIGMTDPDTSFETFFSMNLKLLEDLRFFSTNFRLSGTLANTNTRTVLPLLVPISQMVLVNVFEIRAALRFWATDADLVIEAFTLLVPGCLSVLKARNVSCLFA